MDKLSQLLQLLLERQEKSGATIRERREAATAIYKMFEEVSSKKK